MEAIEYGLSSINFKSLKEGQIKAVVGSCLSDQIRVSQQICIDRFYDNCRNSRALIG